MKEVMAIIRMNQINRTKKALAEAGITSMHARECLGRGKGLVDLDLLKGAEAGYEEAISLLGNSQRLIPKGWCRSSCPTSSSEGQYRASLPRIGQASRATAKSL